MEIGETSARPVPKEVVVSSIDSDEVDSVVRALEESDEESTTIKLQMMRTGRILQRLFSRSRMRTAWLSYTCRLVKPAALHSCR